MGIDNLNLSSYEESAIGKSEWTDSESETCCEGEQNYDENAEKDRPAMSDFLLINQDFELFSSGISDFLLPNKEIHNLPARDENLEQSASLMCDQLKDDEHTKLGPSAISDVIFNYEESELDASVISDILSASQIEYLKEEALLGQSAILEKGETNDWDDYREMTSDSCHDVSNSQCFEYERDDLNYNYSGYNILLLNELLDETQKNMKLSFEEEREPWQLDDHDMDVI